MLVASTRREEEEKNDERKEIARELAYKKEQKADRDWTEEIRRKDKEEALERKKIMREEARERDEAAKKEANRIQKETNQINANMAKIMSLLQLSTANSQQETKEKEERDK